MSIKILYGAVFIALFSFSLIGQFGQINALSGSDFQAGRIIDDSKFFSGPTMSIVDIQAFLNAKVPTCDTMGTAPINAGSSQTRAQWAQANNRPLPPYTCLKDFGESTPSRTAEPGLCNNYTGGAQTGAEIIYRVSEACGINPQVLIVLLQKEQSLITDDWPWPSQYQSATGYGCPDTADCNAEFYGYFNQVYNAARQFKRYNKDPNNYNYRAGYNNYILFNPNVNCGGSTIYIQNNATAALYNYTPYQPNQPALNNLYGSGDGCSAYGNRNFWRLFNDWFGTTLGPPDYSCKSGVNIANLGTGAKVIANQYANSGYSLLTLGFLNNTGSKCIETHTWTSGQQTWLTNVASNHPAVDPTTGTVISANLYGDSKDELVFVKYQNTGSGRIEVHTWDNTYQRWLSNVATNHPAISPADGEVISGDTNGDGRDELIFVKYQNTGSGRIEVHTWGVNQQSWVSNVATNHPSVSPVDADVLAANMYGSAGDELVFVKFRGTGSGRIEVHTWGVNQQSWVSNVATNMPQL